MEIKIIITLFILVIFLVWICFYLWRRLREISYSKRSLSVKYGKKTEQFFPFSDSYPYDPHRFRFIGTPIDGIQFEDNRIVFVEFKTESSQLSQSQKKVKELVNQRKVLWEEMRI